LAVLSASMRLVVSSTSARSDGHAAVPTKRKLQPVTVPRTATTKGAAPAAPASNPSSAISPSALPFLSSKQRDVSECKHRERDRDHHRRNQGSKRDVWSPAIEQGCRKKIGAQCDWSKPVKQRKTASEEAERRTDRSADKPEPSTRGQEGQSESRRCQNHGGPAEDHCRPPLNHIASLRGSRLLRHQFRMVGFMTRQRHKTHRGEDRCFPRCPSLILPLGALQ
jgi:hypothetical protein